MELEGIPYLTGRDDCYGLARLYYRQQYGLRLRNYARPFKFDRAGLNLISDNLLREGFEVIDVPLLMLQEGDALTFAITGASLANHVGMYVGNNYFLHHLYQKRSEKSNLSKEWRSRVLNVVRHPEVTRINSEKALPTIDLLSLLPPHVRAQLPS